MREFTTSAKTAQAAGDGKKLPDVTFKLDTVEMVCRAPKDAQLAYLMAAASSSRTDADQVAAVLDFFEQTLDPASLVVFRRRLLNTTDSFDFADAMGIFEYVCEEWSGRPTGSGSAS
ncbi:hypothetical protein [Micromonospora endophytica]|uniref:Uncharacterized protein n=1 Tax=Micromonospora endophytica TaxID=515350 RepID=A0A2W2DQH5_9ACTN|nr:hypothetical protein [Micromonospora endophytica]PZF99416.1 hypothetical protein C1I93_06035 [Micromonospora endophytica]RIW42875.1 hypothetical protein D3H59_21860 [Micromonospora endophytica]BCJ61608.1 hypothetical protein Jiend_50300 [Micromonospora endophytica]